MGLRWSSREVFACAVSLVLGGALASGCGGQAYSEGSGGSAGSMSSGARGGAAGTGGRVSGGGSGGRGGSSAGGGSSGVAAGGSGAIAGGAGGSAPVRTMGRPCNSPAAISGGWVQCADGLLQRSEPAACTSRLPRPAPDLTGVPPELISGLECVRDQDCTARPNGYCAFEIPVRQLPRCEYGCVNDSECGPGQACVCGADIGECAPASCFRGGDCPEGFACLIARDECDSVSVSCETSTDECRNDADCGSGRICRASGGRRECAADSGCAVDL